MKRTTSRSRQNAFLRNDSFKEQGDAKRIGNLWMQGKMMALELSGKYSKDELVNNLKPLESHVQEFFKAVGIERFLKCPFGTTYFLKHLLSEFGEENLLCYMAVRDLVLLSDVHRKTPIGDLKNMYVQIFEKFICDSSDTQVNLPSKIKTELSL